MRKYADIKYDGVLSIAWVALGAVALRFLISFEGYLFVYFVAVWWGVGLLFAISALSRGLYLNFACGLATILAFIWFVPKLIIPIR